jgi:predicted helicase
MANLNLKPTHKPVREYYDALEQYAKLGVVHETAVKLAFHQLLVSCGQQFKWTLIPEWSYKRAKKQPVRIDGALVDDYNLARAYWEAKDSQDDLRQEVQKKFAVGYPKDNIIFQQPDRAILYQDGKLVMDEDLTQPQRLVDVVRQFFEYRPPAIEQWERAVEEFGDRVKDHATALLELIRTQEKTNKKFIDAFAAFFQLCRQSINPNLAESAVEEMLIQHLLTERIFRSVFNNPDFAQRNIIAVEIEKVINALTSKHFSRTHFLSSLDRFYGAIEETAATIDDFSQKQDFLNTVYEKFFQGFSTKVADTHGIVYTPQPIVNFMVKSVEEILQREFGKSLVDRGVHILDPFVGTGNFIMRVMREIATIQKSALPYKYEHELHCNEVMLLPYYIASMNIEHEYFEQTGKYEPFEGICLVDTFEDQNIQQLDFFSPENMKRVERQRQSDLFVVIGNPPYNVGQLNENDNNKNRKYTTKNKTGIDDRVAATYSKASKATLKNSLSDPYVKAIRWASDRIGDEGIVAFVTNNSFIDGIAFDGMRQYLEQEFDRVYVFDLGGNVRKNPKLSGTTHNVFGIQVGVSVNIFVRHSI